MHESHPPSEYVCTHSYKVLPPKDSKKIHHCGITREELGSVSRVPLPHAHIPRHPGLGPSMATLRKAEAATVQWHAVTRLVASLICSPHAMVVRNSVVHSSLAVFSSNLCLRICHRIRLISMWCMIAHISLIFPHSEVTSACGSYCTAICIKYRYSRLLISFCPVQKLIQ